MNSQAQRDLMQELPAMDSSANQTGVKLPWQRPTVTFVPIQVTAGSTKNETSSDLGKTGTFGP